ncbi:MAG: PhzF family phenazine biosynthesis protein, partial [Pigmentiphaga sp.]
MRELPFAGHPTLAAASAVIANQPAYANASRLRQSCGIGIVPVDVVAEDKGRWYWMTQAEPEFRDAPIEPGALASLIGCQVADLADTPPTLVSTGVPWWIVELRSVAALSALRVDLPRLEALSRELGAAGLTVFAEHPVGGPYRLRLRTFAPGDGIAEDPVCGSGNGCVAAFIARFKHADQTSGAYRAEQGVEIGRGGEARAAWTRTDGRLQIRIGGQTVTVATGTLHL